jgi:hypothetical protein
LGTIVLLSVIAFLFFGKWVITLFQGEGTVFVGVGRWGWTRRFSYNQNSLVSLQMSNMRTNDVPQKAILVRTDGTDFLFGAMLKQDAKQFIAAVILKHIGVV